MKSNDKDNGNNTMVGKMIVSNSIIPMTANDGGDGVEGNAKNNSKVDRDNDDDLGRNNNNNNNNNMNNNNVVDHGDNESIGIPSSVASVDTGTSPSTNPDGQNHNPTALQDEETVSIARKENNMVLQWRLLMFAVLFASMVGVAIGVFFFVDSSERAEFNRRFEDDSFHTLVALGNHLDLKLGAIDSFVVPLVSYADVLNETWPFVTLRDHAVRASKIRSLANAINVDQYQIVTEADRARWEDYAVQWEGWVQEALTVQAGDGTFLGPPVDPNDIQMNVSSITFDGTAVPLTDMYAPTWQSYPIVKGVLPYNNDVLQHQKIGAEVREAIEKKKPVITRVLNIVDPNDPSSQEAVDDTNRWAAQFVSKDKDHTEPLVRFLYPVLDTAARTVSTTNETSNVVAVLATTFYWSSFLKDILPASEVGLVLVFENSCNQSFTYQINGPDVVFLGPGDIHDRRYSDWGMATESSINELSAFNTEELLYSGLPLSDGLCMYTVSTYPSVTMEEQSRSSDPIVFALIAVLIFAFTSVVFIAYDKLVAIRQYKVMKTAVRSAAIVSSLFPSNVRERLYNNGDEDRDARQSASTFQPNKLRLKSFLNEGTSSSDTSNSDVIPGSQFSGKPIADLFTDCTVIFADIANFTSWCSAREPGQVFMLLETIYGAFDVIAARRGVFKVETIGDSYVAVVGLPERRGDHAIVMAKFARDCRRKFHELCSQLETYLGPETGDLGLRIGLHSGPVTAGVLRGQKSRFQLFGDTVNTAARMESTGCVNRIQVSQSTADLIMKADKGHWLNAREEKVEAKGKGTMQTFWVEPKSRNDSFAILSAADGLHLSSSNITTSIDSKTDRLIRWNVDVLARLLQKILIRRDALKNVAKSAVVVDSTSWQAVWTGSNVAVLREVKEIIELPAFDPAVRRASNGNYGAVMINDKVLAQLSELVFAISQTYHKNPFHNFEHASHVCMSVVKLMSRIVAPDVEFVDENQLHDHTYGITSDPLTQFAVTFAALIHDADHVGVPNNTLVQEGAAIAALYDGKSVAEQNSVNLAWSILMEDKYTELRNAICATQEEVVRFRNLVVNAVMATDIMDKDLKKLRDDRWNRAFSTDQRVEEPETATVNRKATIVIEHLIQASDVSHTMQHWHMYRKWNERLFLEMRKAYNDGRSENDPATFWYQGELSFFDFYIIPLARKLSDCGVFGVSSDEYLNYAKANREEWEKKGKSIVEEYIASSSKTANKVEANATKGGKTTSDEREQEEEKIDARASDLDQQAA